MKSFATSICPIKNPLAVNMMHPRAIPAPSQPGKSVFYRMLADSGPFSWTSRCSLGAPVGLRHGDLAYRCFIAISTWQSSHLSALRHGDPAQRCLRAISAWQTIPQPISKRFLSGVITGLRHGNQLTEGSEAAPRGELVIYRPFGTTTLPRGISEASPRGKAFFYPAFGTTNLSTGTPEASSCGGLKPVIYSAYP